LAKSKHQHRSELLCSYGFKHSDSELPNKIDSKNDVKLEIHLIGNYEEFSYSDSSVRCFNEYEDCEDVVVEEIAEKHQKMTEGQDAGDN
jgi:hypothetical protein